MRFWKGDLEEKGEVSSTQAALRGSGTGGDSRDSSNETLVGVGLDLPFAPMQKFLHA